MYPRYQIFVSSTYRDLRELRERVIFELMRNGYIAVGMEQFHASGEEQMEYIRPLIDQTDYYVVIIKGRYGSPASDGVSYTEKEYRYAVEKGVPVLAFLYEDIGSLSVSDTDNDPEALKKFNTFRKELMTDKMVSFWNNEDDLVSKVKDALHSIIFRKPGIGWIRGDQAMEPQVYKELEAERKKRIDLEAQLAEFASSEISFPNHLAHGDDLVFLNGAVKKYPKVGVIDNGEDLGDVVVGLSWGEIFKAIAEDLFLEITESRIIEQIAYRALQKDMEDNTENYDDNHNYRLFFKDRNAISIMMRSQFQALGLITTFMREGTGSRRLCWRLTEKGRTYISYLRAIRRS